jgi:LmbE family N-acetylglucosaminyl deacetylase
LVSIYFPLIVFFSFLTLALGAGKAWFTRHFRKPRLLRTSALSVSGALLALNLAAYALELGGIWRTVDLAATIAGTAAVIGPMLALRTSLPAVRLPRRVLAIGAHPDDLELACGGTLAKFVDSGHEVVGVVMSDGKEGGDRHTRCGEAQKGASFLGLTRLDQHTFTDTKLQLHEGEMVQAIEAAINRLNPDIILTHSLHDQHQDHQAVHRATLRAARQHSSILCYESPSATREFDPSFFVEIDDYMDAKVQAVQTHVNQAGKPYMTPERVRGIAAFRGSQAKRRLAEAYEPVRMLSTEADIA